jgi:hypothetical protein
MLATGSATLRLDLLPYEYSRLDLGPGGEQDG